MSTAVFSFKFLAPEAGGNYSEQQRPVDLIGRSLGGKTAVLNRAGNREFVASGWLVLDDSVNSPSDFDDFVEARDGRVDTFLYRAQRARFRQLQGGSLGTGDGSTVAFAFSNGTNLHKHIIDGDHSDDVTLRVYVDGTLQTITTDYTVSGNDSDLTVTFEAGSTPAGSTAITVDYEYYVPVRFARDSFPTTFMTSSGDGDINVQESVRVMVELIEDFPGARYA